ncbi:uncharacterized protein LOC125190054 [Salvia hispanica]|uniref:uncharacterized protein LOC125190054 n=1 Tax=Salvia hispanica TaxID=49212 RepID=UPI00200915E9|nr:uncharacterized protein LOC125190054 [Salvia hispanica]
MAMPMVVAIIIESSQQLVQNRSPSELLLLNHFYPLQFCAVPNSSIISQLLPIASSLFSVLRSTSIVAELRERDRVRAQARNGQKPRNPKDDGLTPEQRRERDAKALQEKAAKKAAQAAVGGKASADHTKSHNKK